MAMISLAETTLTETIEGEAIVVDLDQGTYFTLNETGTRMLEVMLEADSLPRALELLGREFEVAAGTLRADLQTLIDELAANGLLAGDGP